MNWRERLARIAELSDEELTELLTELQTLGTSLAEGDHSDEALTELEEVADATEQVRAQIDANAEDAAQREQRAAALAERIRGEQQPEGDGEGDDGDDSGDDDEAEEGDEISGDGTGEALAPVEVVDEEQPEQLAASTPAPRVGRVAARRPRSTRPQAQTPQPQLSLVAAANAPGVQAGERLDTPDRIVSVFQNALDQFRSYSGNDVTKVPLAMVRVGDAEWGDRFLGRDVQLNAQRIARVTSHDALVAAGGICAPVPVRYDLPILGTDARPVRDEMLARFGADRGGVRTMPPPVITQLADAIDIWTEATDADPGAATKGCLTVTCPTEDETLVQAITKCLRFGNFRARFWPEQIEGWMQLAAVHHARTAENELLTQIAAGSTATTAQTVLGSSRDVLAVVDRATAYLRNRHRLPRTYPFRLGLPEWLLGNIRTDLTRELPGSSEERLATADAQIESFFAVRNVNVTWFLDGESGQIMGTTQQGAGPLVGWPTRVLGYLYPEGSWLFLDGGELDLGMVRDSTLNAVNDVQMFSETFEAAHFHGVESLKLDIDICPDGSTSAAVDINPCASGS